MKTITVIFVFLVNVLPRSDATFNWTHQEGSVEFTEERTARLTWTVDVGISYSLFGLNIVRGKSNTEVIKKTTQGIIKQLSGRESDTDLIIDAPSNIANITFVLRNLVREDEMSYKITAISSEPHSESKTVFLKVLALPVLQFQPNQTGFCVQSTVNITCTVKFDKPLPSNFTFFVNDTNVDHTTGTLIIENTYRGVLMSKALIHVGAFPYTCQANNETDGLSGISDVTTIVVKDPPHITSCKDNIVEEGSSLFWQCSANGSEPLSTSWHRGNNTAVVQSGNSLTIRNVSRADGGLYTFKASNGEGCAATSKTVQLDVQYKPEQPIVIQAKNDYMVVSEGDTINMTCLAKGNPKPYYQWSFGGQMLFGITNDTISIKAKIDDNGTYMCTAINKVGSATINVALKVHYIEDAICDATPNPVSANSNFVLKCSARAYPHAVNYTWMLLGNEQVSQPTTTVKATAMHNGAVMTCKAQNHVGIKTCSKTITVHYIVEATCDAIPSTVKENANFVLNCSAAGYPPVNYTWVLPGSQDVNQPMRTVKATVAHDGVKATCRAMNGFGNKECTQNITVHYKPRNIAISPSSVPALNTDDALTLKCTASSNPVGTYTWSLDGKQLTGETGNTLTKAKATPQDAGHYTCTVTNSEGSVTSNMVVINVNYLPKIKCDPHHFIPENTTGYVFKCNKPRGSPAPSLSAIFKGDNYNVGSVALPRAAKTLNGSIIQCLAKNSLGKAICETKLFVGSLDLRACLDVSYALVTNSCLVSIPADGFPKPNLTCDVHNATKHNYTICSGGNVDIIGSNCHISNSIRSCNFTIPVFARVPNNITKKYTMTIANQEFKEKYAEKDSSDFKDIKKSLERVLHKIYKYVKYVIAIDVMEFFPGSVHVNFEITMVANVSDPLVPLQRELNRTQGPLDGQYSIDRGSIRSGWYVPKLPVTTTTEPPLSTGAIIGIAIGCAVFFIIIIVVLLAYWCYRKKKKAEAEKNDFLKDENGMPLRYIPFPHEVRDDKKQTATEGVENKGMSPSQDIASGSQVVVKMKDNASTSKTGSK